MLRSSSELLGSELQALLSPYKSAACWRESPLLRSFEVKNSELWLQMGPASAVCGELGLPSLERAELLLPALLCLQVSRQNCFASKFVPIRTAASNFLCLQVSRRNCSFASLLSSLLCFLGFSNLSKNCAACELPFLNGSCDVASGVSWIARGGAEVGGRR